MVHEVKKSDKVEHAHIAQVTYYLYVLARNGVEQPSAIIEYPKLKQRECIDWNDDFLEKGKLWEQETEQIASAENCPPLINKPICKNCSYFELCYVGEEEV